MDPRVIAEIVAAAAQDILFACAVGCTVCALLLRGSGAVAPAAALARWQAAGYGMLLAVNGLYLWLQAAVMSGTSFADAGSAIGIVLTESHFGVAWLLGTTGTVLAGAASLLGARGSAWSLCGALLYAAGKAAAGHAADAGDFSWAEALQTAHLAATALWAGSVMAAAIALRPWRRIAPAWPLAFRLELSRLAAGALAAVVITGVYNAVHDTARTGEPLLLTAYGRLLALKLMLVTAALMIAGWNRMAGLPPLRPGRAPDAQQAVRHFDRLLALEALVLLAVLGVAAVLGHTSPQN